MIETNKLMNLGDGQVLYNDLRGRIESPLTGLITTPAAIQSFTDGAEWPMEMEIAIEPVQDLHGYDHPWPGGGGKNLVNMSTLSGNTGTTISATGNRMTIVADGSMSYQGVLKSSSPVFSAGTYYIKANVVSNANTSLLNGLGFRKVSGNSFVDGSTNLSVGQKEITITIAEDCYLGLIINGSESNRSNTVVIDNLIISTVDVPFEPYENKCHITGWDGANVNVSPTLDAQDATVYTITFPSSAGTVYGGTLTVHADGTGELVVYKGSKLFSELSWTYESQNERMKATVSDAYYDGNVRTSWHKMSHFDAVYDGRTLASVGYNQSYFGSGKEVYVKTQMTSSTDFASTFANARIIYNLLTPVVYTLSAPQVLSLIGLNQIWADCGNINELSYVRRQDIGFIREDTAGQIKTATDPIREELNVAESSLAIVIDGDKAPKAIASGKYLFVKNHSTLATGAYHATAAISSGANVTSNNTSPDADGIANKVRDNFLISNDSNYVSIATSYNINDSFTAPEDGIYLIQTAGDDNSTGIWYIDSQRTKPIIANRNALSLAVPVPLKKGTTIYSRNTSGTAYYIYGYYKFN